MVGFDNYLMPGLCDIGITTYAVDIPEMARMAVRMLLEQTHRPALPRRAANHGGVYCGEGERGEVGRMRNWE